MRRRKETKVRRTWQEKQKDWLKYWSLNRGLLAIAIWLWLIVLAWLLSSFLIAPRIYKQHEAEAKELESQMDFLELIKEEARSQKGQSKWERKTEGLIIPKDFKIHIKSSKYRVTLIVHFVRREGKMTVHCITNDVTLSTVKDFIGCMVIIMFILLILTIPIYYFLCFLIFLFTEGMSRIQRRRKP
ncbi:MAG: hypothetical protein HFJ58_02480 [Clostridia bacterium]|nr:hypothetical protein [Clostridia bacterium]